MPVKKFDVGKLGISFLGNVLSCDFFSPRFYTLGGRDKGFLMVSEGGGAHQSPDTPENISEHQKI